MVWSQDEFVSIVKTHIKDYNAMNRIKDALESEASEHVTALYKKLMTKIKNLPAIFPSQKEYLMFGESWIQFEIFSSRSSTTSFCKLVTDPKICKFIEQMSEKLSRTDVTIPKKIQIMYQSIEELKVLVSSSIDIHKQFKKYEGFILNGLDEMKKPFQTICQDDRCINIIDNIVKHITSHKEVLNIIRDEFPKILDEHYHAVGGDSDLTKEEILDQFNNVCDVVSKLELDNSAISEQLDGLLETHRKLRVIMFQHEKVSTLIEKAFSR